MASSNSRMYSASEVLSLLEGQEDLEEELGAQVCTVDLFAKSDDDDQAEGDGTQSDGCQVLVDAQVLGPESGPVMSLVLNSTSPAARDSMLLLDPDLSAPGILLYIRSVINF